MSIPCRKSWGWAVWKIGRSSLKAIVVFAGVGSAGPVQPSVHVVVQEWTYRPDTLIIFYFCQEILLCLDTQITLRTKARLSDQWFIFAWLIDPHPAISANDIGGREAHQWRTCAFVVGPSQSIEIGLQPRFTRSGFWKMGKNKLLISKLYITICLPSRGEGRGYTTECNWNPNYVVFYLTGRHSARGQIRKS